MSRRIQLALVAIVLAAASTAVADHHEQPAHAEHDMSMGPMGPPEQIQALAYMVGDWNTTMKARMGPDAPWMEETGTAKVGWALDGGAIHMDFAGEWAGMPMQGMMLLTYDREESRYESIWIDNFACRTSQTAGQMEGTTLSLEGVDLHQGREMHMKHQQLKNDDGTMTWTMDGSWDGENWYRSMEIVYTPADGAR